VLIANDPESRAWVEIASVNPELVAQFRPSLLCMIAVAPDHSYHIIGSGFVIAASKQFALAITATHVLVDFAARIQRPAQSHAPTALFVGPSVPSIEPQKLRAAWMGDTHTDMLIIPHVGFNATTDLSCCLTIPQAKFDGTFLATSIPLDTAVPRVGDIVHMVSNAGLAIHELVPPSDPTGKGQTVQLIKSVSIRVGVVTGVHQGGFRQYRWPCFTTTIPAEPGMSGGFVFLPRDGQTIAACGMIAHSSEDARTNQKLPGESVIASVWPALGLRCPETIPLVPNGLTHSIYTMMQLGRIEMAVGGLDHIRCEEKENGDCIIERG
jgi:hypothetical protein